MTNKMTYSVAIENAINGNLTDETIERLKALQTQLAKRNATPHKPTKTQVANESIKNDILGALADGAKQCKDVASALELSTQKVSALLKQMVDAGTVEKYTEKRVTYFKVA